LLWQRVKESNNLFQSGFFIFGDAVIRSVNLLTEVCHVNKSCQIGGCTTAELYSAVSISALRAPAFGLCALIVESAVAIR
jgi:hypothetical protein